VAKWSTCAGCYFIADYMWLLLFAQAKWGPSLEVTCHTPIFDQKCHWHVSLDPAFIRRLTPISLWFSVKNSAERYFKILMLDSESGPLLSFFYLLILILILILNTIFYQLQFYFDLIISFHLVSLYLFPSVLLLFVLFIFYLFVQ